MRAFLILCCLSSPFAINVSVGQDAKSSESGSEVLDLLLRDTPKPDYGASVPMEISGRVLVHAAEAILGAEGASVTNGYSDTTTVKYEDIYLKSYDSVRQLTEGLRKYFQFYCHERPHSSLGKRTPAEMYLQY